MELKTHFDTQRASLSHFFQEIDEAAVQKNVDRILETSGTIYFSGVGKSGFICQKIAATFTSIGKKAAFLSPIDALHGDIGSVDSKDLVFLLSKSGETEELIKLVPFIHSRGAHTISWTCAKECQLSFDTHEALFLPLDQELCPFNLAPTTSATLQLMVGDAIAMAVMERLGTTKTEYYKNHPSGSIGKKMSITVQDLMLRGNDIPTLSETSSLKAAILLLTKSRKGCVLVTDEQGHLLGIFTDGDVKRVLSSSEHGMLDKEVGELMTRSYISLPVHISAWEAAQRMQSNPDKMVQVAPVIDNGLLVGLITMHDIVRQGIR